MKNGFKKYKNYIFAGFIVLLGILLVFAETTKFKQKYPHKTKIKGKVTIKSQISDSTKKIPDKYIISGLPGNIIIQNHYKNLNFLKNYPKNADINIANTTPEAGESGSTATGGASSPTNMPFSGFSNPASVFSNPLVAAPMIAEATIMASGLVAKPQQNQPEPKPKPKPKPVPIPEPSFIILTLIGLAGVLGRRQL